MPNSMRLSFGALVLAAAAACSNSSEQPTVSADLEQDLARAGGANVQLAGNSANRIDVVSASERVESPAPAPKAKTVTRAPSATRGTKAPTPKVRRETPAPVEAPREAEPAPAEVIKPQPEPVQAPQERPRAPVPSRQPEPRGGWSTPGEVIRNAPFPINP